MMKIIFLFLLLFWIDSSCYSREKDIKFVVTCSEDVFLIKKEFSVVDSFDMVTFSDWSFLDSLRFRLEEFYSDHSGFDTVNAKIGSIRIWIDSLGNVSNFSLLIYRESSYLYSLETIESLIGLLTNFHFDLPDYKKPIKRIYRGTERYKKLDNFCYFDILYSIRPNGVISTGWDGLYERQLSEMLLGDWQDGQERNFVFYKSSFQIYVKMLNPLTGIVDDFRCVFRAGRLYMYFDQETPSIMSYKFTDDRLTLSGAVGDQKVIWELKREHPIP